MSSSLALNPLEPIELPGRGNLRLRADVTGPAAAPPALLLHGGGQTRHSWHKTASALAERGWRAYTVDLRGHGDSDWAPDADYSVDAFAADLLAIAHRLKEPAVFIGASLGGISSLVAIGESKEPIARALVLVDVAPRIEAAGSNRVHNFMLSHAQTGFGSVEEVADAIAAYNPNRPRPKDLSGLRKNLRLRSDGRWVWHWDPKFVADLMLPSDEARISAPALERAARTLTIPTLLVRGRSSDLLSKEGAEDFLRLVPSAEFVDVEGAGHMIAGDRNDVFNQAIVRFLDRRVPNNSTAVCATP